MRRSLAISLLLFFSLSLIAPLVAPEAAEASLPACCRRDGKHHCAMSDIGAQQGKRVSIVAEKCPYAPAAPVAFHLSVFSSPANDSVFAALVSHPAVHAQTAAQYRISFDRSRQKRGPPTLFFL